MAETPSTKQPSEAKEEPSLESRTESVVLIDKLGHPIRFSLTEILKDGKIISVTLMPRKEDQIGKKIPQYLVDNLEGLYRNEMHYFGPIRVIDIEVENPEVKH